jgi:hypothetical protein
MKMTILTTLLNRIPGLVWLGFVLALAVAAGAWRWEAVKLERDLAQTERVMANERRMFEAAYAQASDAYARQEAEFREMEQRLNEQTNQLRRERDVQVAAARRAADDLRERLRVYTDTPLVAGDFSVASATAATRPFGPGSLGALLRDEAATAARFLIDEAERADTIRVELMRCYAVYDQAMETLKWP